MKTENNYLTLSAGKNFSLLVHTFDQYKHLWPGYFKAFDDNWGGARKMAAYWGTDVVSDEPIPKPFIPLYSGSGEWSDRLKNLLHQIPDDYVFYMQEDMYPHMHPLLGHIFASMLELNLLRLQVSPIIQFYSLHGSDKPFFFHQSSKYLVSHQPSFWQKDFLLSCLEDNETPWVNEYEGTKRLAGRQIEKKIAIYPLDWFKHKCIKGQVVA